MPRYTIGTAVCNPGAKMPNVQIMIRIIQYIHIISVKPYVSLEEGKKLILEEVPYALDCEADGNPAPEVVWTRTVCKTSLG